MLVVNRNSIVSILATVLVSISLFVVGCSETEDDIEDDTEPEVVVNSQPSIGAIPDQTLDMGAEVTVAVNITDADVDNTHTISASSNDKTIATVSVKNTTLTISGVAGGMATITVSAVDGSGQDNATSTPVTFQVTIDANSQPSIGALPDQTLDMGGDVTVAVNITDADVGDTHTISASSDDTAIATVSVQNTTLTISGVGEGMATITVSAVDGSGQDNATSTPVSFQVTVLLNNTVPGDPAFSDVVKAANNGDDLKPLFDRATRLRAGLEFPRDTFAVNEKHTILVAHTPEGKGLVLIGRARFEVGGDVHLGWLIFVNRGDLRVLTHYDPE